MGAGFSASSCASAPAGTIESSAAITRNGLRLITGNSSAMMLPVAAFTARPSPADFLERIRKVSPRTVATCPRMSPFFLRHTGRVIHATTILSVRHHDRTVMAGDGQVTLGNTVVKQSAKKIRRLYNDSI